MIKKPCLISLQFFCSYFLVLKSSVKLAKDCVKLIYVVFYLVVANLCSLTALSAVSVPVHDVTGLKHFPKILEFNLINPFLILLNLTSEVQFLCRS